MHLEFQSFILVSLIHSAICSHCAPVIDCARWINHSSVSFNVRVVLLSHIVNIPQVTLVSPLPSYNQTDGLQKSVNRSSPLHWLTLGTGRMSSEIVNCSFPSCAERLLLSRRSVTTIPSSLICFAKGALLLITVSIHSFLTAGAWYQYIGN